MISFLSSNLVRSFTELGVINKEDQNIYIYGAEVAIIYLMNFAAMIIISILLGMVKEFLIFMLIFIPLKSYTGGYHAPNYKICFFISCLVVTTVLIAAKYMTGYFDVVQLLTIIAISGIIIYKLGPIEDKNKPLTENDIVKYRGKILLIFIIEFMLAVLSGIMGLYDILFLFCCSYLVTLTVSSVGMIVKHL